MNYYLSVKFVERSPNSLVKNYTYMHNQHVEPGSLVVVEVSSVPRLVIVESCTQEVPHDVAVRKYKNIRGTVNDRRWRTAQALIKEHVKIEVEFEQKLKEHMESTARRAIIGNDPLLLSMFNRLEQLKGMIEDI